MKNKTIEAGKSSKNKVVGVVDTVKTKTNEIIGTVKGGASKVNRKGKATVKALKS